MEHFLNHLGLYMVTETDCGTTEHLQLFTLITSLVFMELILSDTSVTWIKTGAFSHPRTTGMILSSELTQCFWYIIPKMQFTFSWKPKAQGTVQVWGDLFTGQREQWRKGCTQRERTVWGAGLAIAFVSSKLVEVHSGSSGGKCLLLSANLCGSTWSWALLCHMEFAIQKDRRLCNIPKKK